MPRGDGRYTEIAEETCRREKADAVVLIVLGGKRGSGFSLAAKPEMKKFAQIELPRLLEDVAKQIRAMLADG